MSKSTPSSLTFTCPECGCNKARQLQKVLVAYDITAIHPDEEGMEFEEDRRFEDPDAEHVAYECKDCGASWETAEEFRAHCAPDEIA